jgi:ubiquinone biosynthesis monooxygenase Coq7
MRVDHTGEVAAQALYHGQALTARTSGTRDAMEQAAREEGDHLRWCAERLVELDDKPSRLDPLWYMGSFLIGAAAGLAGDRWSLGFVAETERQVVRHLDGHLSSLPQGDARSRAILEQMRVDEGVHATTAIESGAADLPQPVKRLMTATARLMTETAYRI